jgi:myosin heavy subunit
VNTLASASTTADKQTYDNIFASFETFGYSQEEQDALFTLISAILLIGNLAFKPETEKGKTGLKLRC